MLKRTLTGAAILLITALAILGRSVSIFFFDCFVMVISFVACYEMIKIQVAKEDPELKIKNRSYIYLSLAYCYIVYMCYAMAKTYLYAIVYQLIAFVVMFIIAFIVDIIYLAKLRKAQIEIPTEKLLESTFATIKLMLYPVTLISTLYGFGISGMAKDFGTYIVILILAVTMLTDVFAYIFGMTFHKGVLASQLSPKKSISGAIGGLFGGILASALVYIVTNLLLNNNPFAGYSDAQVIVFFALVGIVGSVLVQIGDLVASYIKRKSGVKDYGKIFPGHGGMMDRIDGLMMCSMFTFLSMIFIFLI